MSQKSNTAHDPIDRLMLGCIAAIQQALPEIQREIRAMVDALPTEARASIMHIHRLPPRPSDEESATISPSDLRTRVHGWNICTGQIIFPAAPR